MALFRGDDAYRNEVINSFLKDIQILQQEIIENMLGEAIKKGIITTRDSKPVLVHDVASDKLLLRQSIVIDYLGAEKIEELEKENEYLKKLNGDLHKALSDFYEKTKENQWLKRNP